MNKRITVLTLSVGSFLALGLLFPATARATSDAADKMVTAAVKTPETPKEHLALADAYKTKTAAYREDAAMHRQMLETYKKQVASAADGKTGVENPWIKKERLHCEEYIRDAEKLAASAEKFAEFHTMRAAELQGK